MFAYLLFFADPAEGAVTQGMLMGSVTVVIVVPLLLLVFFDHPHGDGVGRLDPIRSGPVADQVDVATLIAWADADRRGEKKVADFYVDRFRPEFLAAYDAWIALRPFSNPQAPSTPFAMDEYQVASKVEAERLDAAAEASAAEVRLDIQRSSNYVLTVVLYAVVLFFAGMTTSINNRRLRWVMTIAGCVVLLAALAWLATFPVSLKV